MDTTSTAITHYYCYKFISMLALLLLLPRTASTHSLENITNPVRPWTVISSIIEEDLLSMTMLTMTSTSSGYEFVEVKIAMLIERFYIPPMVTFGIVGNFLSFFTLTVSSLRRTSTCVYMAVIALLDNAILIFDLCVLIRFYMGHTEFYFRNNWACGFHKFFFYFSIHFVTLTLVAMTVDRYLVVTFPLKAQIWSTPKSAMMVMLGLGLFSFALNFHTFFMFYMTPSGIPKDPESCWYANPVVAFYMQKIYTWIDASIYSFIPFISLLVLNVLIIRQLEKSRSFGRQFIQHGSRKDNSFVIPDDVESERTYSVAGSSVSSEFNTVTSYQANRHTKLSMSVTGSYLTVRNQTIVSGVSAPIPLNLEEESRPKNKKSSSGMGNNITFMLLMVSFTFLFLTSPVVIVLLYKHYYWQPSTEYEKAKAVLTHAVVDNLMYTNHAVNFLLYLLSGRRFRLEFKRCLALVCFCRRP